METRISRHGTWSSNPPSNKREQRKESSDRRPAAAISRNNASYHQNNDAIVSSKNSFVSFGNTLATMRPEQDMDSLDIADQIISLVVSNSSRRSTRRQIHATDAEMSSRAATVIHIERRSSVNDQHLRRSCSLYRVEQSRPAIKTTRYITGPICQRSGHIDPKRVCRCNEQTLAMASKIVNWTLALDKWQGGTLERDGISVSMIGVGSFNIAFEVRLDPPTSTNLAANFVMRLPQRLKDGLSELPILRELDRIQSSWNHLSVPRIYSVDPSTSNLLDWPYIQMERLPGKSLNHNWQSFSLDQRCDIARQLGMMYRDILMNTIYDRPGLIVQGGERVLDSELKGDPVVVEPLGAAGWISLLSRDAVMRYTTTERQLEYLKLCKQSQEARTPVDSIKSALEWRMFQFQCASSKPRYDLNMYHTSLNILADLEHLGVFREIGNSTVICHTDLFPRNIVASTNRQGAAVVDGIIDWDGALYGPPFVACRPPKWLWRDCYFLGESEDQCNVCNEAQDAEREDFNNRPHNSDGEKIQQAFLNALTLDDDSSSFRRMMFDPAFIMARLIFDVACNRTISFLGKQNAVDVATGLRGKWDGLKRNPRFQHIWNFNSSSTSPRAPDKTLQGAAYSPYTPPHLVSRQVSHAPVS